MDLSVSPKDEILFLRVCHHISNTVYYQYTFSTKGKISDVTHPSCIITNQCTQSNRFNLAKTRWLYHRHEYHIVSRACCTLQVSADLLYSKSGTQMLSVNSHNRKSLLHDVELKKCILRLDAPKNKQT